MTVLTTIPNGASYKDIRDTFNAMLADVRTLKGLGPTPTPAPPPTPTPAVTPLPSGIVAMWDASSITNVADGAAIDTWTDKIASIPAAKTGDSGASHTYVANSGGLPAVRLSGAAVLSTTGTNAANTAMTGDELGIIVVARNILTAGANQANPVLVASGGAPTLLLQATPTQTGRYGTMYDCGDPGMRTLGHSNSTSLQLSLDDINGTAVTIGGTKGGQITIGGWQNAGTSCCGRADILAIIVFNRAPTAADFKQVHRRYCELLGQTRPGGATARTVTCVGDSLTAGYPEATTNNYPFKMAAGLGLPWGTWDAMGVSGFTWYDIKNRTVPMLGNVSGATGNRSIVCAFEFANMRTQSLGTITGGARQVIDALHAADPNVDVVFGTSTDDGSGAGVETRQLRADYNAFWDSAANRSGIAAYVQSHLDPNIGVSGAAPTNGSANTYYQSDGLHLQTAGSALLDNGPRGFRAAVQQRLAAS